jgi:hypothetical protein
MTKTDLRMQQLITAKRRRRQFQRALRAEREVSQISSFIMIFAETLDTLIPGKIASAIGKTILRRRMKRR